MTKILQIIFLAATLTLGEAIRCDFVYQQADVVDTKSSIAFPLNNLKSKTLQYDETKNAPFECDDPDLEDYVEIKAKVNERTNFDEDEYEPVEDLCHPVRETINPVELNDINNKLRKIAVIQSLSIEKCANKAANCARYPLPPEMIMICKQKYLTITLKAYNDQNKKYDGVFYYPSACICSQYLKKSEMMK